MKILCGTDIIEVSRIKKSIDESGDKFLNRVFTENEIKYCKSRGKSMYERFAGRFAVKEAVFKALSNELEDKYQICWKDIECLNDKNGRPYINLLVFDEKKIESIDVSISHCKEYAIATVVGCFLEGNIYGVF